MIEQTGAKPAALNRQNIGERLAKRAATLASIRHYFTQQQVLEVETPLLGKFPVTDPQLDNLRVENPFAVIFNEAIAVTWQWFYLSNIESI